MGEEELPCPPRGEAGEAGEALAAFAALSQDSRRATREERPSQAQETRDRQWPVRESRVEASRVAWCLSGRWPGWGASKVEI